jgi:thioredoxin reductase
MRLAFLLLLVGGASAAEERCPQRTANYCIVGAGPGGIQFGHFLSNSRAPQLKDYLILERHSNAGSFFRKYPKNRELISINKRFHSRGHGIEYEFRQDWNSLIGRPEVTPVVNRTDEFFPQADIIADYMEEFASEQVGAGKILFHTSVEEVKRTEKGFRLRALKEGKATEFVCMHVVMSTGLWEPNIPKNIFVGKELLLGYDELPSWRDQQKWKDLFTGKDVAIIGLGNAAMEVAQALFPTAASVSMFGRGPLRFSDKTHYPGDIRAHRRQVLDQFMLKMASVFAVGLLEPEFSVVPCQNNRRCILEGEWMALEFTTDGEEWDLMAPIIEVLKEKTDNGTITHWTGEVSSTGVWADADWFWIGAERAQELFNGNPGYPETLRQQWKKLGLVEDVLQSSHMLYIRNRALVKHEHTELRRMVLDSRSRFQVKEFRDPYDLIVRCTGWKHNTSVYHKSAVPALMPNGKHAQLTPRYESTNVSGLYFAGTLAHGIDFRKAAGGFIHGFRYTARALLRILERGHGLKWGAQTDFPLSTGVAALEKHLLWRIQESSGPYQMYDQLVDGVIFAPNCSMIYLEEVPKAYFDEEFKEFARLRWVFTYGQPLKWVHTDDKGIRWQHIGKVPTGQERTPEKCSFQQHQQAHLDTFLHPLFTFSQPSGSAEHVHVGEDFVTRWQSGVAHLGVIHKFIHRSVQKAYTGSTMCKLPHFDTPSKKGQKLPALLANMRQSAAPSISCPSSRSCDECIKDSNCAWCLKAARCVINQKGQCQGPGDHVGSGIGKRVCPPPARPSSPSPRKGKKGDLNPKRSWDPGYSNNVDTMHPSSTGAADDAQGSTKADTQLPHDCKAAASCHSCTLDSSCAWCIRKAACMPNKEGSCDGPPDHVGSGIGSGTCQGA